MKDDVDIRQRGLAIINEAAKISTDLPNMPPEKREKALTKVLLLAQQSLILQAEALKKQDHEMQRLGNLLWLVVMSQGGSIDLERYKLARYDGRVGSVEEKTHPNGDIHLKANVSDSAATTKREMH